MMAAARERKKFCDYSHPSRAVDWRSEDLLHEVAATEQHANGVIHCRIACRICQALAALPEDAPAVTAMTGADQ